jgi:dTDP-4-amino-4,6-dideoxygalactose transaminase
LETKAPLRSGGEALSIECEKLASQGGAPVRAEFLPYALPQLGAEEKREIAEVLESGWITTGPRVQRFEAALAEATGAKHVVCLSSCTAALHLALVALDLAPGDEVITSPLTFCSTANVIVHAGARPVLADVEPDTLNLDPERVEAAIGPNTRAILPVHFGGHACEMDALLGLARRRRLAVVEDAAHAMGARYRGHTIGTLGDATCYSFYATKNMTTAEGGALATGDDRIAERARVLSRHGMSNDAWKRRSAVGSWYYEVVSPGFKYNMGDLQAALGLHQLARLPGFNERRRALAARYDDALGRLEAIEIPARRSHVEHVYHLYPIRLRLERLRVDRARFIDELRAENIGTTVNFIPIHHHPFYREHLGLAPGALPAADAAYERLVSLPLYPAMSDRDAGDVLRAVAKVARALTR